MLFGYAGPSRSGALGRLQMSIWARFLKEEQCSQQLWSYRVSRLDRGFTPWLW